MPLLTVAIEPAGAITFGGIDRRRRHTSRSQVRFDETVAVKDRHHLTGRRRPAPHETLTAPPRLEHTMLVSRDHDHPPLPQ
ncbi:MULTISPECIES: hypothetical protein [unclassified Nocardia]|uniref:hypothetical protein n=1 Tax=unclassified Nocardia TaxID=2637762 RepID=UPI0012E9C593|nr:MULTISPECIES: hypothetical protein [unclassified Nocardia]MBF6272908.1 hypothetical protein [Nocardia nova]